MNYDITERARMVNEKALERWDTRLNKHQAIVQKSLQAPMNSTKSNKCKFIGSAMVKYINMQITSVRSVKLEDSARVALRHI